jgi:hypothetical protein
MESSTASKKKVTYEYEIKINKDILMVLYLSYMYRLDLESMILLYERLGKDLFLVFFMFSGKNIVLPKHTRFVKIHNFVIDLLKKIDSDEEIELKTLQEKNFKSFVDSLYNKETKTLTFTKEIPLIDE